MTRRVSAAEAELSPVPFCPNCEGSGTKQVKAARTGTVHEVQCDVCRGEGVIGAKREVA